MKKVLTVAICSAIALGIIIFFASGFIQRNDVKITDFTINNDGTQMTIFTSVASSAGYTRSVKAVKISDLTVLYFYNTFGGINSNLGAKNTFNINLDENTKAIAFDMGNGIFAPIIEKSEDGTWKKIF